MVQPRNRCMGWLNLSASSSVRRSMARWSGAGGPAASTHASHRSRLAVLLVEVDEWESMFPDLLGSSMMRRLLACFAFSCTQRLHYKAVSAWRSAPFKEGVHVWM